MAQATINAVNWDGIALEDLTPARQNTTQAPTSVDWDRISLDDLTPDAAVDYGNGARGWAGGETGGDAEVSRAGKRDLYEIAPTYADLNNGLGGQYSPFVHGISLGAMDEISSGGIAPLSAGLNWLKGEGPTSLSDAYDQEKAVYLRDKALYEEENPIMSGAAEIAGGVMTGGAGAKLVASAPTLLSAVGRSALIGGAEGGAYGALDTEGTLFDRLQAGTKGAAIGAGVGVLAPGLERALPAVGRGISSGINSLTSGGRKMFRPAAAAEADFVHAAARDRVNWGRADAQATASGRPPPAPDFGTAGDALEAAAMRQTFDVGDLGGERARAGVREALASDVDAADLVARRADSRMTDQGARAEEIAVDLMTPGRPEWLNPATVTEALRQNAQRVNRQAYREAFDNPASADVWTGGVRGLTGSDSVLRAFADALQEHSEDFIAKRAKSPPPSFQVGADGMLDVDQAGGKVSLEFLDRVQKTLRDQVEAAKVDGKMTNRATRIEGFRSQLLEEMDRASTVNGESLYRKARGQAKAFFDAEDSYEAGIKFASPQKAMDLSKARQAIDGMSDVDRELFRQGYAAALIDKIAKLPDAKDVEALLNNRAARQNLRLALGDDKADAFSAYLFRDGLARSMGMIAKKAAGRDGGAELAGELGSTAGAAVLGSVAVALVSGDPLSGGTLVGALFGGAGRALWGKMSLSRRQAYAQALAKLVTSDDPATIARIHTRIMSDPELARLTTAAASRGLVGGLRGGAYRAVADAPLTIAPGLTSKVVEPTREPIDREDRVPGAAAESLERPYASGGRVVTRDAEKPASGLRRPGKGHSQERDRVAAQLRQQGVRADRAARLAAAMIGHPGAPADNRRGGADRSRSRVKPERLRAATAPTFDKVAFVSALEDVIAERLAAAGPQSPLEAVVGEVGGEA